MSLKKIIKPDYFNLQKTHVLCNSSLNLVSEDIFMLSDCIQASSLKKTVFLRAVHSSGLGPNNENTLKNSLNSCQVFRQLKLLTNIFDCIHMKQFKGTFLHFQSASQAKTSTR
jgi:hypothetical protein